jgi:hypothetical protein
MLGSRPIPMKLDQLGDFCFLPYGSKELLPLSKAGDGDSIVKTTSSWSYCGQLLDADDSLDSLPSSFDEWSRVALNGSLRPHFLQFLQAVNSVLESNGIDHYWVTIRATERTAEFDMTRWHTDDYFYAFDNTTNERLADLGRGDSTKEKFLAAVGATRLHSPRTAESKPEQQTDWKICASLLGPSTLFIPAEFQSSAQETQRLVRQSCSREHVCTSVRCVGCATAAEEVRIRLDESLRQHGTVSPAPGELALFRVGERGGAVHSEPCMNAGGRIFVNVVPGTRKELSTLMQNWGMEFPRSWWIASGVLPDTREVM